MTAKTERAPVDDVERGFTQGLRVAVCVIRPEWLGGTAQSQGQGQVLSADDVFLNDNTSLMKRTECGR